MAHPAGEMEALVCLLIGTHALPPLGYRVPDRLEGRVGVGSAVVAPLSGISRIGVVLEVSPPGSLSRATEEVRGVLEELSPGPELVELCRWASERAAVPLAQVLRGTLPPGLDATRYRVRAPLPDGRFEEGALVSRRALRRALGSERLRRAEVEGFVELAPGVREDERSAWAVVVGGVSGGREWTDPQRRLFEELVCRGGEYPVGRLLEETGARRDVLRRLAGRGAVRIEVRPPEVIRGSEDPKERPFPREMDAVMARGGAWLWRRPSSDQPLVAAGLASTALSDGFQTLVLVPTREDAERVAQEVGRVLPEGRSAAVYHAGLAVGRAEIRDGVRTGRVDVLIGTRSAVFVPFERLGAICVLEEPDLAHRAEEGYEGVPLHVRDLALQRARVEGASALFLSPVPSLELYARRGRGVKEIAPPERTRWPAGRVVDLRGTGARLGGSLVETCRQAVEEGMSVGVVVTRVGHGRVLVCNGCGAVAVCPRCGLSLSVRDEKTLVCNGCGKVELRTGRCPECGSGRMSTTGIAADGVRSELSRRLARRVGLLTAGRREGEDAGVVVGTPRPMLASEWDVVALPDVDGLLLGRRVRGTEEAFRLVYRAAERTRTLLVVQSRVPDHYALRAALEGDYPAFARSELSRRRAFGYPPFAHLAEIVLEGDGEPLARAVEFFLEESARHRVEAIGPAPGSKGTSRRLLLRGTEPHRVAAAALEPYAALSRKKARGLKVRVTIDPQEV